MLLDRLKSFLKPAAVVILVHVPLVVDAQDNPDRWLNFITQEFRDLRQNMSSLDGADAREVAGIRRDLVTLGNIVDNLKPFERDFEGITEILRDYEDDISRFDRALEVLVSMAEATGQIESMIEHCEEGVREFSRYLQNIVSDEDAELDDLERAAENISREIEDLLDDAADILRDLEGYHRTASRPNMRHRDFTPFNGLMNSVATSVLDNEKYEVDLLLDSCEDLVDYEGTRQYQNAVAIFEDFDQAIEAFVEDGQDWLDEHEDLGEDLCVLMQEVQEAYCSLDMEDVEEDPLYSRYSSVVQNANREFRSRVGDAIADYERDLAGRGRSLAPRDSAADEMYERLRTRVAYYYRVEASEILRNMNNVADRLWTVYGQEQHKRLQNSTSYCHVVERTPPGMSRRRADCVDLSSCVVWEIKSDTHSRSSALSQAGDYADAINRWMEGEWDEDDQILASSSGPSKGMEFDNTFLEVAVRNRCLENGRGQFTAGWMTYPSCDFDRTRICEPMPK